MGGVAEGGRSTIEFLCEGVILSDADGLDRQANPCLTPKSVKALHDVVERITYQRIGKGKNTKKLPWFLMVRDRR